VAREVLVFEGVSASYVRGVEAISNVTFRLAPREVVFLLGPNGGGKSTVLKVIVGAVRPSRGSVRLFGVDVKSFREWWRVGYLPQNAATYFERMPVSVGEFLEASKAPGRGLDPADALRILGLDRPSEVLGRRIQDLSGGSLQRVMLAASLINRPELLLLDEPTTHLDQAGVSHLLSLLEGLRDEWGLSAIVATHDVAAVSTVATRVICINRGSFFDGDVGELVGSERLCGIYGFHVYALRHGH